MASTADYAEAIALLCANMGKGNFAQGDIASVFKLVARASERPVLAEKAEEYARALKEGGCDKVEDLAYFDRPFYASAGVRYADVTQWLEVLAQWEARTDTEASEERDEEVEV